MAKRPIPPLVGPRTQLRLIEQSDYELTRRWRNRAETRVQFYHSQEITESEHRQWLEAYQQREDDFIFIVLSLESGAPIGQTALYSFDDVNQTAEFGRFMIGAPSLRGLGYGREALGLTCRVGFEFLDLQAIELVVKPQNSSAIRSYRSVGFTDVLQSGEKLTMRLSAQQWQTHASDFSN